MAALNLPTEKSFWDKGIYDISNQDRILGHSMIYTQYYPILTFFLQNLSIRSGSSAHAAAIDCHRTTIETKMIASSTDNTHIRQRLCSNRVESQVSGIPSMFASACIPMKKQPKSFSQIRSKKRGQPITSDRKIPTTRHPNSNFSGNQARDGDFHPKSHARLQKESPVSVPPLIEFRADSCSAEPPGESALRTSYITSFEDGDCSKSPLEGLPLATDASQVLQVLKQAEDDAESVSSHSSLELNYNRYGLDNNTYHDRMKDKIQEYLGSQHEASSHYSSEVSVSSVSDTSSEVSPY